MKNIFIQIGLSGLILLFMVLMMNQCSDKRQAIKRAEIAYKALDQAEDDYIELVKAKTRIDTVYKPGEIKVIHKTDFKTITDTIYVEGGKVYGVYKDSINSPDLKLQATITASDLKAIDYTYEVTQKIITERSIITEHDTVVQTVRKGQLLAVGDIGLDNYAIGLHWQSRKRIGFGGRFTMYNDEKYFSAVVSYRIK